MSPLVGTLALSATLQGAVSINPTYYLSMAGYLAILCKRVNRAWHTIETRLVESREDEVDEAVVVADCDLRLWERRVVG